MNKISKKIIDRFLDKIKKTRTCWLWTGYVDNGGYGNITIDKKTKLVHRVSYELFKEQIPKGLQIDHLCRVRNCINPDHLEAVTPKENALRGFGPPAQNARKKTCKKGHKFTHLKTVKKRKYRACRICARNWDRKKYRINKIFKSEQHL
jgi:hypothetical protein